MFQLSSNKSILLLLFTPLLVAAFGGGVKCWVTTPSGGPETCSVRIVVTALFPKK